MRRNLKLWLPFALLLGGACSSPTTRAASPEAIDFYVHVNHAWMSANPVPAAYGSWGVFHEINEGNKAVLHEILEDAGARYLDDSADPLTRQLGTLWASGMNEEKIEAQGIESIRWYLDRIDAVTDAESLAEVVGELHMINVDVLFGLGAEGDLEDSTMTITWLSPSGLGLPERDYYFREDEASAELRAQYLAHMGRMFALAGASPAEADAAAGRVYTLEQAMAQDTLAALEYRDPQVLSNKIPSSELAQNLIPAFQWGTYFRSMGLDQQEVINTIGPRYFRSLNNLLTDQPLESWRDYLRWHLITRSAPFLSNAFVEEDFDFYSRKLSGTQVNRERWERVLSSVNRNMGDALGRAFVQRTFSPEAKKLAQTMVADLLDAYRVRLAELPWMTAETKTKALEKLDSFTVKIGYPDKWRDYSGLVLEGNSWVENQFAASIFNNRFQLAKIGKPVDKTEWGMSPQTVNAYYNPLGNEIVFPAAILQPPFFGINQTLAQNYGSMGAIIGHEITHGFDDMGSQFDAEGNLVNWWTDSDREEFDRRASVLVEQFNNYAALPDLYVNGELTLGENIADLGGLQMAYLAFQKRGSMELQPIVDGLTPNQQFFTAWARSWRENFRDEALKMQVLTDEHAPNHFRANGPLSNLPQFADAFRLDESAPMVRPASERAEIW